MMYETFDKETATTEDRIAWTLCQIIDDDAPMRWTRYRFVSICIARNEELMADLQSLATPIPDSKVMVDREDLEYASASAWANVEEYDENQAPLRRIDKALLQHPTEGGAR